MPVSYQHQLALVCCHRYSFKLYAINRKWCLFLVFKIDSMLRFRSSNTTSVVHNWIPAFDFMPKTLFYQPNSASKTFSCAQTMLMYAVVCCCRLLLSKHAIYDTILDIGFGLAFGQIKITSRSVWNFGCRSRKQMDNNNNSNDYNLLHAFVSVSEWPQMCVPAKKKFLPSDSDSTLVWCVWPSATDI